MKKIQFFLLFLLIASTGIMAQSGKSRYIKPSNYQKRVTTVISEKNRYYYSLSTEQPSVINVEGPGILRVMSRGRFVPGTKNAIKYQIVYTIDGGEKEIFKVSGVNPSTKAAYMKTSLGVPGALKDFEIELGRGYHTLEFFLKDDDVPVAMRYKFTPTKGKKQEWIAFSPLQPATPVDLISRESTVHYYRFSTDNPLKVEINGPTELRVLTRIENHYQMKGRIHYRIQVKENGEVINTYQLSSVRSEIAVYKTDKTLVPGKAREFVINVPRGRHSYEITVLDKNTVLGRFLIPKKDVKLKNQ